MASQLEYKVFKTKKKAIENTKDGEIIVCFAGYYIVGDIYTFMAVLILDCEGNIIGSERIREIIGE